MVPSIKNNNPLWHANNRFTGFCWREGMRGPPVHNFTTDECLLIVAAVIWLKYCQCGVNPYPFINFLSVNWITPHLIIFHSYGDIAIDWIAYLKPYLTNNIWYETSARTKSKVDSWSLHTMIMLPKTFAY